MNQKVEGWNEWLSACLSFLAAGCFFLASAAGRDSYHLLLTAGILNWITGFCWLMKLRPGAASNAAVQAAGPKSA